MLPSLIAQQSPRRQPHTQHLTQPLQRDDPRRYPILLRVEHCNLQVFDHSALARQAPAQGVLVQRQSLRQRVDRLPAQALHQARMATAGTATVGHVVPSLVQGIEQIAAGRHRPAPLAHGDIRHQPSSAWRGIGFDGAQGLNYSPTAPACASFK